VKVLTLQDHGLHLGARPCPLEASNTRGGTAHCGLTWLNLVPTGGGRGSCYVAADGNWMTVTVLSLATANRL
jgi:hypothetical protein